MSILWEPTNQQSKSASLCIIDGGVIVLYYTIELHHRIVWSVGGLSLKEKNL